MEEIEALGPIEVSVKKVSSFGKVTLEFSDPVLVPDMWELYTEE